MQAARLHKYDPSIPAESLKVEQVDEPRIQNPFDVIVRVGAAGLCRTDIHVVEGQWAPIQDAEGGTSFSVISARSAGALPSARSARHNCSCRLTNALRWKTVRSFSRSGPSVSPSKPPSKPCESLTPALISSEA